MRRILILGGTTQARRLAERLADRSDLAVTLSLAGRTAHPATLPVPVRSGGFGGPDGLALYIKSERVDALVDATHPYASRMAANAARAAAMSGVAFMALKRPPWIAVAGDRWIEVADLRAAAAAPGTASRRVFLALGRNELAPFVDAPQHHYLVRSVDPVDPPLAVPHARYITARGPFLEADERALLREHDIEIVVAKNSGGDATYGKIAAARSLGLAVVLLARPALPSVRTVATVEAALAWIDAPRAAHATAPADRDV
jgi:precorrin-6A/cobalt-precorrin-6A reductase